MQSDYQIEEMVFQTREHVVYRALHKDGTPRALLRIKYSGEILANLREQDRFQKGLDQLCQLNHPCLRPVVDGGLDPIDGQPWVAARWWEGQVLSETPLTQEDIDRLRTQGRDLIRALGDRAGALSFSPAEIVTSQSDDGQLVHTFAIDYFSWFRDWAIGYNPGEKSDPHASLAQLISSLAPTAAFPKSSPLITTSTTQAAPAKSSPTPAAAPLSLPLPKSSPLKPILLIGTLIALIGAGIWWINQRPSKPSGEKLAAVSPKETPATTPQNLPQEKPPGEKVLKPEVIATAEPKMPAAPEPVIEEAPAPAEGPKTRPEDAGSYLAVEANDVQSLKENVGEWVKLTGKISAIAEDQLEFEDSSLVAHLPENTPTGKVGQEATVKGLLQSETLLAVKLPEDLQLKAMAVVLEPGAADGDIYTIADEEKLRGMEKATVTIQAIVTAYFESGTGASLYLDLGPVPETFAIRIYKKAADKVGIDEASLRAFVGKQVKIKGQLEIERFTDRLLIKMAKKSDLEIVAE